jgi:hypothetical protein
MDDEPPIDFGPLDPARDPARWSTLVAQTAARARARRRSLARIFVAQAVPALALAAAAAIAMALLPPRAAPAPSSRAAAPLDITRWAYETPAPDQVLATFGGFDGGR